MLNHYDCINPDAVVWGKLSLCLQDRAWNGVFPVRECHFLAPGHALLRRIPVKHVDLSGLDRHAVRDYYPPTVLVLNTHRNGMGLKCQCQVQESSWHRRQCLLIFHVDVAVLNEARVQCLLLYLNIVYLTRCFKEFCPKVELIADLALGLPSNK